jgi:hypothetical protein
MTQCAQICVVACPAPRYASESDAASDTCQNRLRRQVDNPALVDIVVKTQEPGRMALSDMDNSAASGRMRAHRYSNNARRRGTCTTIPYSDVHNA